MPLFLRLMGGLTSGGLLFIAFSTPFSILRFVIYLFAAWSYAWVCLHLAQKLEQ